MTHAYCLHSKDLTPTISNTLRISSDDGVVPLHSDTYYFYLCDKMLTKDWHNQKLFNFIYGWNHDNFIPYIHGLKLYTMTNSIKSQIIVSHKI